MPIPRRDPQLVQIRDAKGNTVLRLYTSLTRTDVGSGACEILWVEAVDVDRLD